MLTSRRNNRAVIYTHSQLHMHYHRFLKAMKDYSYTDVFKKKCLVSFVERTGGLDTTAVTDHFMLVL